MNASLVGSPRDSSDCFYALDGFFFILSDLTLRFFLDYISAQKLYNESLVEQVKYDIKMVVRFFSQCKKERRKQNHISNGRMRGEREEEALRN